MRAILLAGGLSLLFTLVGTRYAIRVLSGRGYGQLIRDDGPTTHHTKRGTPTMGGLVIVFAVVASLLPGPADHRPRSHRLGPAAAVPHRRARHGRVPRRLHQDLAPAQPRPAQPGEVHRPDVRRPGLRLPGALALAEGRATARPRPATRSPSPATRADLTLPVIVAGAVHLADDRRRQQRHQPHRRARRAARGRVGDDLRRLHRSSTSGRTTSGARVPTRPSATTCATRSTWPSSRRRSRAPASGSCGGTPHPAKIFMGDTGSLALGGGLAGLAVLTRTEFLLALLGGLFVIDHALGDPAGRLLQADQGQTAVPDGAPAPPLRDAGLGGDHHRDPLLADRRASAWPPGWGSSTPSGSSARDPAWQPACLTSATSVATATGAAYASWSPASGSPGTPPRTT